MKSTRFRGGWLAHTGPSPRRCEDGGAFFKVGGMRGRPGVQSGSRRLVACQHHDVPLVPRDRWIYTQLASTPSTVVIVLSSPFIIDIQFVISPASIEKNYRSFWFYTFDSESRESNYEPHQTTISNLSEIARVYFYLRVYVDRARILGMQQCAKKVLRSIC